MYCNYSRDGVKLMISMNIKVYIFKRIELFYRYTYYDIILFQLKKLFAIPIILENCFIKIIKIGDVAVEKTFVLDTNVLLQTPYALYSFGDNTIVIHKLY